MDATTLEAMNQLATKDTGMSRRPVVVLLHSSAGSARQWDSLIGTLEPRFRVRAVEFHGHGTRPDWSGNSPLSLGDDAALVVPMLAEPGGVHVVGHSYGAAVGLKLATLHPGSVRSVVAYEPVLFRLLIDDVACRTSVEDVVAVADFLRTRLAQGDAVPAARRFIEFWSGAGAWDSMSPGRQHTLASRMGSVLAHFDALFREPAPGARLARLSMPILVLTGAQTVAPTRRIGEMLRTALPMARHKVLPGMGHMGPITHAVEVNRQIEAFLDAIVTRSDVLEGAPA